MPLCSREEYVTMTSKLPPPSFHILFTSEGLMTFTFSTLVSISLYSSVVTLAAPSSNSITSSHGFWWENQKSVKHVTGPTLIIIWQKALRFMSYLVHCVLDIWAMVLSPKRKPHRWKNHITDQFYYIGTYYGPPKNGPHSQRNHISEAHISGLQWLLLYDMFHIVCQCPSLPMTNALPPITCSIMLFLIKYSTSSTILVPYVPGSIFFLNKALCSWNIFSVQFPRGEYAVLFHLVDIFQ